MDLPPHQERVINEKSELDMKIVKLEDFIRNNIIFKELHCEEQLLLYKQSAAMKEYSDILRRRIEKF